MFNALNVAFTKYFHKFYENFSYEKKDVTLIHNLDELVQ